MIQSINKTPSNNYIMQACAPGSEVLPYEPLFLPKSTMAKASDTYNHREQISFQGAKTSSKKQKQIKTAPAVASAFLPGIGQMINGEWGKGLSLLAGFAGTKVLAYKSAMDSFLNGSLMFHKKSLQPKTVASTLKKVRGPVGSLIAMAAFIGLVVYSVSDAVKGANKNL